MKPPAMPVVITDVLVIITHFFPLREANLPPLTDFFRLIYFSFVVYYCGTGSIYNYSQEDKQLAIQITGKRKSN